MWKHEEIAKQLLKQRDCMQYHEKINQLRRWWHWTKGERPLAGLLMNKMEINFYVFSAFMKDFMVSNVNRTSFVIMRGCLRKMSPDVSNQRSQTRKRKCTISRFRIWARNYKLFLAFLGRGEDLKNTHKPVVDFQPLISLAQLESE